MEDRRSWPWQTSQEWKSFRLQASLNHQTPLTACIHSRASIPQRKQWYRWMSKWLFSFLSVCSSSPTHPHPDLVSMSGTSWKNRQWKIPKVWGMLQIPAVISRIVRRCCSLSSLGHRWCHQIRAQMSPIQKLVGDQPQWRKAKRQSASLWYCHTASYPEAARLESRLVPRHTCWGRLHGLLRPK